MCDEDDNDDVDDDMDDMSLEHSRTQQSSPLLYFPVLTANPCATNFAPANGQAGGAGTASGSTFTFTCNSGYTATSVATCTLGSWNAPTCNGQPQYMSLEHMMMKMMMTTMMIYM